MIVGKKFKFWHQSSESESESDSDQVTEADCPQAATSSSEELDSEMALSPNQVQQHAAFRTTSYFLSKLLTRSLRTGRNLQDLSEVERKQLKILNAFSTITVIDSEVVSVIANASWGPTLQLIATAEDHDPVPAIEGHHPVPSVEGHEPVTAPEGHQPVSDESPNLISRGVDFACQKFRVIFTTNPRAVASERDEDPREDQAIPIIVDACSPVGVSVSDLPALVQQCNL
jgi:hypothetical protein